MLRLAPDLLMSVGDLSYADGWAERWDIFGGSARQQRKTPWENSPSCPGWWFGTLMTVNNV
jgi:hypothetical protein